MKEALSAAIVKTIVASMAVAGLALCVSGDERLTWLGVLLLGGVFLWSTCWTAGEDEADYE